MSYTPTTWTTGDTITASAMNKIEQGIANAGKDICGLFVLPEGFNSFSHILGSVGCFKQINNKWKSISWEDIYWVGNAPASYTLITPPESSGIKVFWAVYAPDLDDVDVYFSGNINSTPITVYDDNDSTYNGYEITGIGYVTAVAT